MSRSYGTAALWQKNVNRFGMIIRECRNELLFVVDDGRKRNQVRR